MTPSHGFWGPGGAPWRCMDIDLQRWRRSLDEIEDRRSHRAALSQRVFDFAERRNGCLRLQNRPALEPADSHLAFGQGSERPL
jgi:hypothetical protein